MTDVTYVDREDFLGELEEMDLSSLKDKTFVAGINTGDKNGHGIISRSMRGPFDFFEMVSFVHELYLRNMLDAKVIILSKDLNEKNQVLDSSTIDYIHANASNIIMEDIFLEDNKEYTCKAGTFVMANDENKKVRPEDYEEEKEYCDVNEQTSDKRWVYLHNR